MIYPKLVTMVSPGKEGWLQLEGDFNLIYNGCFFFFLRKRVCP